MKEALPTATVVEASATMATTPDASEAADAAAADATAKAAVGFDEDVFRTRDPIGGKSIGHTSVVFKLKLEGGVDAVWKPRSRRGNARYKGEVAAYRLARALDLDNVPPAMVRSFDAAKVRRALTAGGAESLFDQEAVVKDGSVVGALIPWIAKLEFLPLEAEPWTSRWHGWLRKGGQIPDDQRALAAQISTMVIFDFVTGNWDRWSGGNVGLDSARGRLLFIDNDGAFYETPPPDAVARQFALLQSVDRFSRRFVETLRAFDAARLAHAMGEQSPGAPLLSARALEGVESRRKRALSAIDTKIADAGEATAFGFD